MEILGYTHAHAAYEEAAVGIEPELPDLELNWKRPISASLSLLGATFLSSSLNVANQAPASARIYVATNGSCLNVRTGPGTGYASIRCVSNGAALTGTSYYQGRNCNHWVHLSSGGWVCRHYTSLRRGGSGQYTAYGYGSHYYTTIGSRGRHVGRIQSALGISRDGLFGSETEAAVMSYQRQNGLTVDGIVGPRTANSLGLA